MLFWIGLQLLFLSWHVVVSSPLEQRAACTTDNCLRPVESAGAKGISDCSSYELAVATTVTT